MKRPIFGLLLTLLVCLSNESIAARFWVSASASNWNNTANWSTVSGGAGGASVPGAADAVTFNSGGSGNCTIDVAASVASLNVAATYTGTIIQGPNSIAVSGAGTFAGGTFTGGSANITVTGVFTLSGTSFNSTSAVLELDNNSAFTGGTFTHNNGSVFYNGGGNQTISGTSPVFYILQFAGNGHIYSITAAGNITVINSLNLTGASLYILNTGTIAVNGDINVSNTAVGCGGNAIILINGTGTQNFNGSTAAGLGALPQLTINCTGTLNLTGFPSVANTFIYTAGTVNAGTSTFCFTRTTGNFTITGSLTLNNITFIVTANTSFTIAAATTLTADGNLSLAGTANITLNTGNINVNGNVLLTNTGAGGGGSTIINIVGTGSETIDGTAITGDQSLLPLFNINSSGTVTLAGNISFSGNVTYTAGTIIPGTSTCYVANTLTMTGTFSLYNLTLSGAANMTLTITAGSTVTVTNTLDLESAANNISINTGTIAVQGNIIDNNTGTGGGGNGIILIKGTGTQTITSTGVIDQGRLPSVTLDNTGGTISLPSLITIRGTAWTYIAGTLDVTTNNSTVVFENGITITGNHTLNNVTFDGSASYNFTVASGTTLTVTGTLTTIGAFNVNLNTSGANGTTIILAQGNIVINNTGVGGGSGNILIDGAGAQALTSTSAAGQGILPYITIQKASGTLTLSGIISAARTWTYISGTVDATTDASTVVFGGNNLNITSAGMSFYNVTTTANTSTLTNSMTLNNNLTISGLSVLAPGANTVNIAGNWSSWGSAGFNSAASTVNFNGSALQTITSTGGATFSNLIINNSSTGVQLENNATVTGTLTMTQGNIDLNGGNALTLGLSVLNNGTLAYTAGAIINTGSFTRWLKAATIAAGSVNGLFPVGTAATSKLFYVSAPATAPTTGGTVTVAYNDAAGSTSVSFADGASTVAVIDNLNWAATTGNGLAGGTYSLEVQGTGFGAIGNTADLRLTLASSVVGVAGVNAGTTADPQVNRTGLSLANLSNTFYMGSVNAVSSPLPVELVSFTAVVAGGQVKLDWETAMETNNDYFTVQRSKDGVVWDSLEKVSGSGNSNSASFYTAYDPTPYSGNSYYRLRQTDFDDKQTYSAICTVNIQNTFSIISIFPNPATNAIAITFPAAGKYEVRLFNSAGHLINNSVLGTGSNVIINVSNTPSGIYIININYENHSIPPSKYIFLWPVS